MAEIDPRKVADWIIAQAAAAENARRRGLTVRPPNAPTPEEQLALARSYLALASAAAGTTLAALGTVYVTHSAAVEYRRYERMSDEHGIEQARRELTEMLIDAKPVESSPGEFRFRRRSVGLDITARVKEERRLMVVTRISVRDSNAGGRRG